MSVTQRSIQSSEIDERYFWNRFLEKSLQAEAEILPTRG